MNSLPRSPGELAVNDKILDQTVTTDQIVLLEERLKIDLRKLETGSVQIHKKVVSEQVRQQVPVISEKIQIEHKPMGHYVETYPVPRTEGDTTIISVVKEVLVIEKRLMLVEEIHLTKTSITTTTIVSETLRKEEVEIIREDLTLKNTTNNQ